MYISGSQTEVVNKVLGSFIAAVALLTLVLELAS